MSRGESQPLNRHLKHSFHDNPKCASIPSRSVVFSPRPFPTLHRPDPSMPPTPVICPHCSAPNAAPGKFCVACGRALPSAVKLAPRVISGKSKDFAESSAGQAMQMDELGKQARSASQILMVLGTLSGIFGGMLFLLSLSMNPADDREIGPGLMKITGVTLLVLSAIYFSLAFWAKKSPLPASITGLVLYTSLAVVDLVAAPTVAAPGIIVKIIIIAALAKAVTAGVKHRELSRRVRTPSPNSPGPA